MDIKIEQPHESRDWGGLHTLRISARPGSECFQLGVMFKEMVDKRIKAVEGSLPNGQGHFIRIPLDENALSIQEVAKAQLSEPMPVPTPESPDGPPSLEEQEHITKVIQEALPGAQVVHLQPGQGVPSTPIPVPVQPHHMDENVKDMFPVAGQQEATVPVVPAPQNPPSHDFKVDDRVFVLGKPELADPLWHGRRGTVIEVTEGSTGVKVRLDPLPSEDQGAMQSTGYMFHCNALGHIGAG